MVEHIFVIVTASSIWYSLAGILEFKDLSNSKVQLYLIQDGGNVAIQEIKGLVVKLELQVRGGGCCCTNLSTRNTFQPFSSLFAATQQRSQKVFTSQQTMVIASFFANLHTNHNRAPTECVQAPCNP